MQQLRFLMIAALVCAVAAVKEKPFANLKHYSVAGILSLPYAEIAEPFRVWYSEEQFASRIDYYDGMVKTIQLAPSGVSSAAAAAAAAASYGTGIKIAPMTDEQQTNVQTCFWVNGTQEAPTTIQSVIPDFSQFDFIGETSWKGVSADQWQLIDQEGDKKNTYTFYVNAKTGEPLYYEMIGYDSLLGSHYDKYYVEYFNFNVDDISPDIFAIKVCPGVNHKLLVNPMQEFFHLDETHRHADFNHFRNSHGKKYASESEHATRLHLFKQNVRYIESMNRKGLGYTLAINHLADKSEEEIRMLRGKQRTKPDTQNNGLPFDINQYTRRDLPDSFDWRIYGAVTPVKDQGVCGSCWSFGTTGAIEGALYLKHKHLVRLSPQNLIDCSWGFGNNGCDGGEDFRAYDWIIKHGGIMTEEAYGAYKQADGYCHFDGARVGAQLSGYVNVTPYDSVAVKTALVNQGPISVAIDAGHKSFVFYDNGVYYEPDCGNKPENLDHAVLLVGYGSLYGQNYWLIKNSWSTYWGNDGYVLMSQKDNNCGVTTQTTYPIIV